MSVAPHIAALLQQGAWVATLAAEAARLRAAGRTCFDLSLGNPDQEPPAEWCAALRACCADEAPGVHAYLPGAGLPAARAMLAADLSAWAGVPLTADDLLLTCGAAGGLHVALAALCSPGDAVVVFAPYFPEYLCYLRHHQLIPLVVPTTHNFRPDLAALETALAQHPRVVLLNSPNNPTGVIYTTDEWHGIGALLRQGATRGAQAPWLLVDDAYHHVVFDGRALPSPFAAYAQTIVVGSLSKALAIPGERIGYLVAPGAAHHLVREALALCNRTLGFVNAPMLMQRTLARLSKIPDASASYQRRRDLVVPRLQAGGYRVVSPGGGMFLLPQAPTTDDEMFVRHLAASGVLAVPGSVCGAPGYFRLALCLPDEQLRQAMDSLCAARQTWIAR